MKAFRFISLLLLLLQGGITSAQEITARILDLQTKQPIPYATIVYAEDKGVITNEEGIFSLVNQDLNTLTISSMGYETLELAAASVPAEILLKPSSIQLNEVFLSNKNLTGKQIIEKVKESVASNYDLDLSQKRFFFRQSNLNKVNRFRMDVDESTIEGIDQKLLNEISDNVPKITGSYKEVLGDLFGNYEQQKIQFTKAANLHNPSGTERLEELTGELESLFRQSLKQHSYLKVRSGIIGVKVDADELEEDLVSKAEPVEKTAEEKEKELADKKASLQKSVHREVKQLLGSMFWKEDLTFNLFEKSNKYKFVVEGFTHLDGETAYVISFEPKRGADYKGKLYVNTVDYGVHRIDYQNVKPLKRFRLFGISTAEDVYAGKMIFSKNDKGKYLPRYIEQQRGETFGLDRPLTIIEKNKVVPGRNKQNELDLDLDLSFSQVNTYQFVVYETAPLEKASFDKLETEKEFDLATFKSYNPEYWEGTNIIEPNTVIQQFTTLEGK